MGRLTARSGGVGAPSEPGGTKVDKASIINTGENRVAQRNDAAPNQKGKKGNNWAATAVGVGVGTAVVGGVGYGLYSMLPSMPSVPNPGRAYTAGVGGAYSQGAFVPMVAPQDNSAQARNQVHSQMYPGHVNINANPGVTGVQWGNSFQGLAPTPTMNTGDYMGSGNNYDWSGGNSRLQMLGATPTYWGSEGSYF